MGRKRKIPIADEEKENAVASCKRGGAGGGAGVNAVTSNLMLLHGPMYTIMCNVQLNETNHKKYIKELKQLYAKMDHDAFMFTFIKMVKAAMVAEEGNEYAENTMLFCAKFVSSYDCEDTHPLLIDMCKWLLTTISRNPHARYRICQFVNMILKALGVEAALDDAICDRILEYMLNRLHDTSPNVRLQAILAMQRLQVPDNPDDPVLRVYQFHLCADPSSRVRQAVITCMGRNYHTIPYILDRLWDIDEKVRRHTYLHMSSYPVRSYKVSQRLTLLQQGLNDRSESVRKVVVTIMLQQWIESYQKDLIALISALKLDSSEADIERFRKVAKQTLKEIFNRQNKEDLLACIPLETEGEMHRCVPHEKLTMEISLYWQCLTEYLQVAMAEEFDLVVPELSTFCTYVERFCEAQKADLDKFDLMEFQYKLLSLMEILYTFDLGDEIGRGNLQKLLSYLLKTFHLNEKIIEVIVRCAENLITDQNLRLQYFVEIIQDICGLNDQNHLLHDRNLINELLASSSNANLNLKLSSLKVKILDLEEQEMNFVQRKDYMRAQQITEEKHIVTDEYTNLLRPLLEQHPNAESLRRPLQLRKTVKQDSILKSLQIAFYMVVSEKVRSLIPSIYKLYNDFICRHLASNQIAIRDWALKCGTACSMLYEALAKDVFDELYAQFFKNHNIRIWETSITCIFELLDRYGLDNFAIQEGQNKTKKSGRQLYNTLDNLDSGDDSNALNAGQGVGVIYMMSHFLDTCDDVCIISAIIVGFCRLILRGYIKSGDIIEKLLLRYFNPSTDPKINQILGVFLENLIERKKHGLLQPCLLPMISTVLSAPYENPLHDIRPETITRFIIDSTRQESSSISDGHIHNKLATSFLEEMLNNVNNKELCKLLAKELITLELNVMQNVQLKNEMKELADKLIKSDFDPKTIKCIIDFKDLVDGNFNPKRKTITNLSEGEEESNDETEADAKDDDDAETVTTALSNATEKEAATNEKVTVVVTAAANEPLPTTSQSKSPRTTKSPAATRLTTAETTVATPSLVGAPQSTLVDASIITKDISPTARTPTTYGPDNRVGHRYLRKSLNLTRGQSSDTESGEGPPRSPKIRIEARIDSDKKTEQPVEEQRVKSTRARRNLRYNARTAKETEAAEAPAEVEIEQPAKGKKKTAGKEKETPTTTAAAREEKQQKQQNNVSPTAANKCVANEEITNQPQEENTTKSSKSPARATAKNAKPTASEELNTSDIIPASPKVAPSPRTVQRRQRLAGGNNLTAREEVYRATRSHSAQPAKKSNARGVIQSTATAVSGAPTPLRRLASKRALQNATKSAVKKPMAATIPTLGVIVVTDSESTESRNTSPLHKRLRSDTPTKRNTPNANGTERARATSKTPSNESEDNTESRGARARARERTQRPIPMPQKHIGEGDVNTKSNPSKTDLMARKSNSNEIANETDIRRSRSNSLVRTRHKSSNANKRDEAGGDTAQLVVERRSSSESSRGRRQQTPQSTAATTERRLSLRGNKNALLANKTNSNSNISNSNSNNNISNSNSKSKPSNSSSNSNIPKINASEKNTSISKDKDATNHPTEKSIEVNNTNIATSNSSIKRQRSLRMKAATSTEIDGVATKTVNARPIITPLSLNRLRSSKIPVRATTQLTSLLKTAKTRRDALGNKSTVTIAPKPIVSSTSTSSSSSSSNEDNSSKSMLPVGTRRRRELTSKMTRINLTQHSTAPVPMHLARPRARPPIDTSVSKKK